MAELKPHLDGLDPAVVDQMEERMRAEKSSVDRTHPPTVYRLRFLEHHAGLVGDFDQAGIDWASIDAELEPFLEPTGQQLLAEPDLL